MDSEEVQQDDSKGIDPSADLVVDSDQIANVAISRSADKDAEAPRSPRPGKPRTTGRGALFTLQ